MRLFAGVLLVALLGGGVVLAQSPPPTLEQQTDEAARAIRDALEKAMRLLDGALGSIPRYEAPEVLPNGDIIIRRIPPAPTTPPRRPAPQKPPGDPTLEET